MFNWVIYGPRKILKFPKCSKSSRLLQRIAFSWFFIIRFHKYKKAQNRLQRTKIKNVYKKHLSSNINEAIKTI